MPSSIPVSRPTTLHATAPSTGRGVPSEPAPEPIAADHDRGGFRRSGRRRPRSDRTPRRRRAGRAPPALILAKIYADYVPAIRRCYEQALKRDGPARTRRGCGRARCRGRRRRTSRSCWFGVVRRLPMATGLVVWSCVRHSAGKWSYESRRHRRHRVRGVRGIAISEDIAPDELDSRIEAIAAGGLDTTRPFPFLVEGRFVRSAGTSSMARSFPPAPAPGRPPHPPSDLAMDYNPLAMIGRRR